MIEYHHDDGRVTEKTVRRVVGGGLNSGGAVTVTCYADQSVAEPSERQDTGEQSEQDNDTTDLAQEREGEEDAASEKELPSFTLFDFSYADQLLEEMNEFKDLPIDPTNGQGGDVIYQAQNGHAAAQYRVGLSMIAFEFHERDRVMQVRSSWLTRAAERGDLAAQKLLYYLYMNGYGSEQPEPSKAISWLRAAAVQGDAEAQAELAFLSSLGSIEDKSPEEGLAELGQIAQQQPVSAQQRGAVYSARMGLGLMYALGTPPVSRDVPRSVLYMAQARAMRPQDFDDLLYTYIDELEREDDEGQSWLSELRELLSTAMSNDADHKRVRLEAEYLCGLLYAEGIPSDAPDSEEEMGLSLLVAAASQHAGASFDVAQRTFDPWVEEMEKGDEERVAEACRHYERAHRLGHLSAVSYLARCYEVQGQRARALQILQAASHRDAPPHAENLCQLADLYLAEGAGDQAIACYQRLVDAGEKRGVLKLAEIYHRGELVERDEVKLRALLDRLELLDPWRAASLRKKWMTK